MEITGKSGRKIIPGEVIQSAFDLDSTLFDISAKGILRKSAAAPENWAAYLGVGIFGGLGMLASAWYVGKASANACSALGETGKGLVNYLMVLGIGETIALFVMVFSMTLL